MIRVRTIFTGVAGTPYYSNLYFDAPTDAAQVATDAVNEFWIDCSTYMKTTLAWTVQGEVTEMELDGTITGTEAVTARSGVGQSGSEMLPQANQVLLRLSTGAYAGGRQIRGRVFIPGVVEDAAVNGQVLAAYRANVLAGAAALRTDSPGWSVWSKKNEQLANVSGASVWESFAVLRSRRD